MNMNSINLVISATAGAFEVAQTHAFHHEILDGGTQNKFWSFISAVALAEFSLLPLSILWPALNTELYQLFCVSFLAGVYYIASVAHQNQIYINHGEEDKIQSLPFGLHQNKFVINAALFLSCNVDKFFVLLYVLSLTYGIFLGGPASLYGCVSLAMYVTNLIGQQGYFPTFFQNILLCFNVFMVSSNIFGLTSWFNIVFFLVSTAFAIYDYIRCHIWNAASTTIQFPMADPQKKLTVVSILENDPNALQRLIALINNHRNYKSMCATQEDKIRFGLNFDTFIFPLFARIKGAMSLDDLQSLKKNRFHEIIKCTGVHVTFDHFYESHRLIEKILADVPDVNYDDYMLLFNRANFASPIFRDSIFNQMRLHDKYDAVPFTERCEEFNLPADTDPVEVQITFLKREMTYFVDRLNHPSYKDLNHQQIATLHRYARLILNKINQGLIEEQDSILLSIAISTGSHCNRVYLETLSSLAEEIGILYNDEDTVRDRAILQAQAAREAAFRSYYYKTVAILKNKSPSVFNRVFADVDDYHTYEIFVQLFGSNLYLRNPTLTLRQRTSEDIYRERTIHSWLSDFDLRDEKMLFSQTYHVAYLVEQVLNPGGKLHRVFIDWCQEHFPFCFQEILYDEDHCVNKGPKIKALAELMLLDLDILTLDETPVPLSDTDLAQLSQRRLSIIIRELIIDYLQNTNKALPETVEAYIYATNVLRAVKENSLSYIWENIKENVADCIFDEFDMLYESKDSENFIQLMNLGRDIDLNLSSLQLYQDCELAVQMSTGAISYYAEASTRLSQLVIEEASAYLSSKAQPIDVDAYNEFATLMTSCRRLGVSVIWQKIFGTILNRVCTEFHSEDTRLTCLCLAKKTMSLDNLDWRVIYDACYESEGYYLYRAAGCKQVTTLLGAHGIFHLQNLDNPLISSFSVVFNS